MKKKPVSHPKKKEGKIKKIIISVREYNLMKVAYSVKQLDIDPTFDEWLEKSNYKIKHNFTEILEQAAITLTVGVELWKHYIKFNEKHLKEGKCKTKTKVG